MIKDFRRLSHLQETKNTIFKYLITCDIYSLILIGHSSACFVAY